MKLAQISQEAMRGEQNLETRVRGGKEKVCWQIPEFLNLTSSFFFKHFLFQKKEKKMKETREILK